MAMSRVDPEVEMKLIEEVERHVTARLEGRERACAAREKKLDDITLDVQQLLALFADLGHPSTADLMHARFKKSGLL